MNLPKDYALTYDYKETYHKLLHDALLFTLWPEPIKRLYKRKRFSILEYTTFTANKLLRKFGVEIGSSPVNHNGSGYWRALAHTMTSEERFQQLREACRDIDIRKIEGDFVECGVWRGGSSMWARANLNIGRTVWCCDSFEGFPNDALNPECQPLEFCRVSLEEVIENFNKFGLNFNVKFIKGFFNKTLKDLPVEKIAILRADGDMYSSTMDILTNLYNKVSKGGYIIIDDWCLDCCRSAVKQFLSQRNLSPTMVRIDDCAVYWIKNENFMPILG